MKKLVPCICSCHTNITSHESYVTITVLTFDCSLNLSDVDKREDIFSEQDDVSALCAKYCALDV